MSRRAVTVVVGAPTATSTDALVQPSLPRTCVASERASAAVGPGGGDGGVPGDVGGGTGGAAEPAFVVPASDATATPPPDADAHITSRLSFSTGTPGLQSMPHDQVPSERTPSRCPSYRITHPAATAVGRPLIPSAEATVAASVALARGSRQTGAGAGATVGNVVCSTNDDAPVPSAMPGAIAARAEVEASVSCSGTGPVLLPACVPVPHPASRAAKDPAASDPVTLASDFTASRTDRDGPRFQV